VIYSKCCFCTTLMQFYTKAQLVVQIFVNMFKWNIELVFYSQLTFRGHEIIKGVCPFLSFFRWWSDWCWVYRSFCVSSLEEPKSEFHVSSPVKSNKESKMKWVNEWKNASIIICKSLVQKDHNMNEINVLAASSWQARHLKYPEDA